MSASYLTSWQPLNGYRFLQAIDLHLEDLASQRSVIMYYTRRPNGSATDQPIAAGLTSRSWA